MMRKIPRLLIYAPVVALIDLLLIGASFLLLFRGPFLNPQLPPGNPVSYWHLLPFVALLSLVVLKAFDLYAQWLYCPQRRLVTSLCASSLVICASVPFACYWEGRTVPSPLLLAEVALVQGLMLIIYRLLLRQAYVSAAGRSRVMVMANNEDQAIALIRKLESNLESSAPGRLRFVGYLVAKDLDNLQQMARLFDHILLAPGFTEARTVQRKCNLLGKQVMAVPAAMEMSLLRARPFEIDDILILDLQPPALTPADLALKRIFDLVLSLFLLLLSSPLLLLTAAVVRLTSRGDAIFKQDRVGRDGVEYTLYKFRTMTVDAEMHTGPVLAQQGDPRITRLGQLLRATRIDELPQLFNVLLGNMSMIGPRPERRFFVDQFRQTVPDYDLRLAVKPGITGLAQVAGSYSTPVDQKLRFDLLYIFDYSLLLDLSILLRTVLVVFQGERAEGLKAPRSAYVVEEQ